MADYWKSNERKYCEFCNCWIADNKPSIVFHEGGKRHKANVEKRISEISKKSAKDERAKQKVDIQMRQMEDAAMKAYESDILRGGDMTTQSLRAFVAATSASIEESSISTSQSMPGPSAVPTRAIDPLMPPMDVLEDEERAKREKMKRKAGSSGSKSGANKEHSMWVEAKSPEGHTYYWNVKSGESIWEEPKEGYMTIEQYNRIQKLVEIKETQESHEESKFMRENASEVASKYKREQLKRLRAQPTPEEVKQEEEKREDYDIYEEPGTAARPYGQWQTVVKKEERPLDLQLPTMPKYEYVPTVSAEPEPVVRTFKEKTVVSLEDNTHISDSFKKRKFGNKRNARQRLDEDD